MIRSIEVRIIAHATEDEVLLKNAAESLFGVEFEQETTTGHWGNPIRLLRGEVREHADGIARQVRDSIPVTDFPARTEGVHLHVRASKRAMLDGEFAPGDGVKLDISFEVPHGETAAAVARGFWKG